MLNRPICLTTLTVIYMLLLFCGCKTKQHVSPIEPLKTTQINSEPLSPELLPGSKTASQPFTKTAVTPVNPEGKSSAPKQKPQNINSVKFPEAGGSRFLSSANFVNRWVVCGPFTFRQMINKQSPIESIIHHTFIDDEKGTNYSKQKCRVLFADKINSQKYPGRVNLERIYPGVEYAAAYAVAYLDSDREAADLKLYSGGSGYLKIWLNGQLIHTFNRFNRISHWDQDIINGIKLKKGRNQVIVKSITLSNPWSFYFRLTDKDELPLSFINDR